MKTIERHNLLELLGKASVYHSAILTCYTFDPIFFDAYLMPQFRQNGICNIVILLDADHYDQVMESLHLYNLDLSNLSYTIVRQTPSSTGVFHPKVSLLIGQNAGMLLVGSGNLTYNGYSLNEEVWGAFSLKGEESVFAPLFKNAWNYLIKICSSESMLVRQQLKWMIENSNWLETTLEETDEVAKIARGLTSQLIVNDSEGSILRKLKQLFKNSLVKSLKVISPFYDVSGNSILRLIKVLQPKNTHCVFDRNGTYPYDLMKKNNEIKFYEWDENCKEARGSQHHLHGKLYQLDTNKGTYLLIGSANATTNALGDVRNYYNDEACILLHSEKQKDFFAELGVTFESPFKWKTEGKTLDRPVVEEKELSPFDYHIIYSEVIENVLTIRLKEPKGNVIIGFIDLDDNIGNKIQSKIVNSRIVIEDLDDASVPMVVILGKKENEISNRSYIIYEDQVNRFNPNQKLRKLENLLGSAGDWRLQLMDILSYVVFDDEQVNSRKTRTKAYDVSKHKGQSNKIIQKDQFDDLIINDKAHVLSLPNIRIADFLLANDTSKDIEDFSEGTDDISADTVIDDSDSTYGESQATSDGNDNINPKEQLVNFAYGYDRRLSTYYDRQLSDFYEFLEKKPCRLPDAEERDARVSEFSNMLISLLLETKALETGLDIVREKDLRPIFVRNIGQFLLMYIRGYDLQDNYASHKLEDYHKNLATYALSLIAHFHWYGKDKIDATLIILNLLETFRKANHHTIHDLYNLYDDRLDEGNLSYDEDSKELIDTAFDIYEEFEELREDKQNILYELTTTKENCIIFKSSYGFLYAKDFKKNRGGKGTWKFEYKLHHPAFDEDVHVQAGELVIRVTDEV